MGYEVKVIYLNHKHKESILRIGLSLKEAKEICSNEEASSYTCTKAYLMKRTRLKGPWFLSYKKERQ